MADIAETERGLVEFLNGVLKGNVLHILTSTPLSPFPHEYKPPVHQPNMIEWIKRRLAPFLNGVLKGKVLSLDSELPLSTPHLPTNLAFHMISGQIVRSLVLFLSLSTSKH